jgi:hypothetical protein
VSAADWKLQPGQCGVLRLFTQELRDKDGRTPRAPYEIWQRYARANGDIPGALVGELAAAVNQFIKDNPTWVTLEPSAAQHRFGDALKARLLVHNLGKVTATLHVPTWHQGSVKASDAKGNVVEASGLEWTTLAQLFPCRLAPGEFIEINTPGIGF